MQASLTEGCCNGQDVDSACLFGNTTCGMQGSSSHAAVSPKSPPSGTKIYEIAPCSRKRQRLAAPTGILEQSLAHAPDAKPAMSHQGMGEDKEARAASGKHASTSGLGRMETSLASAPALAEVGSAALPRNNPIDHIFQFHKVRGEQQTTPVPPSGTTTGLELQE